MRSQRNINIERENKDVENKGQIPVTSEAPENVTPKKATFGFQE